MTKTYRFLRWALATSLLSAGCTDAEVDEPSAELELAPRAATLVGVATWKNDATAAYTAILDDAGTWPSISGFATTELNKRGLQAGLGAIVKSIQDHPAEIPALTAAAAAGQEIVNHSWTHVPGATSGCDGIMVHACGGGLGAAKEVNEARTWLQENLKTTVSFFIYPYDYRNADVAAIVAVNHLGDRSGWGAGGAKQGVNPANVGDYDLAFEAAGAQDLSLADLNGYVDRAIGAGGWALREMHGVGDGSWGNVSQAEWTGHLDHVVSKRNAGQLWMAGPTTVIKYKRVRQGACGSPQLAGNTLTFSGRTSATCARYATVVSVVLTSGTSVTATQGGQALEVLDRGNNRWIVNMDPTRGDVILGGGSTCTPTTCAAQGKTCGSIADGCGGTLACGTCAAGQTCSASNVCESGSTCNPTVASVGLGKCNATVVFDAKLYKCTSQAAGVNGEPSGCGTPGVYCSGISPDNASWGSVAWQFVQSCGTSCTPTTCAAQGKTCGTIANGCGGTLACGTCAAGQTCSASNVCQSSCTPTTCAAQGKTCGTIANGCGGTLACGTCAAGQTCSASNVCVGGSSCTPSVASYTLGRCNATAVHGGKLYKCTSQAAGVNGEPTGCGTPGVYCSSIAPDNAAWGSVAWQLVQTCP